MQTPNGILPVDKPAGWTSFDVLAKLRGALGTRKLGHSGTLDPMATGVLAVFIGRATAAADRQLNHDKTYEATLRLGLRTDTGAAEYDYEIDALTGEVLAFDYDAEDYDAAQAAQTPPAASGAAITAEEAKQIALEHAGVNEADIRALELETDRDDGRTVYEFSWKVGWTEYDYDIDAATGEILSFSQDVDD